MFRTRIHFYTDTDPDPAFLCWILIRIRVLITKIKKKCRYSWKKPFLYLKKTTNYLSLGLHKGVKATEEAYSPQKRTSSTSKHDISLFFSIFVGQFCPPGSGYGSTLLRNPDPDPEHWCQYTLLVPVFIFPLLGLLELVELGFLGLGQILPDLLVPTFITWQTEKQWFKTLNSILYRYSTLRSTVKVHRKAETFPS